jgi:hypothetical protein
VKEHAWKLTPAARADAHQIPPAHVGSISSRYNEVLRDAPVSDVVHRGFRGVCDTVLTQNDSRLPLTAINAYGATFRHHGTRSSGMSIRWPTWRNALVIVNPQTVIAWHRQSLRLFWTWKSRRRIGRRPVPTDVRTLIRTMSQANLALGCAADSRRAVVTDRPTAEISFAGSIVRVTAGLARTRSCRPSARRSSPDK